jgi:ankyrin repeat protein
MLLSAGANVNATDVELMTPLHYAAEAGHEKTCMLLLYSGALADARCVAGR